MARQIQKFTATLNREGSTGSTRGKIPATLVATMGGEDGDVIEFEVDGKYIVGGSIIKGKEARRIRSERQDFGRTVPTKKTKPKVKTKVVAPAPAKAKAKKKQSVGKLTITAPIGKSKVKPPKASKNKTKVAMKPIKKKGQKSAKKLRFAI